MQDLRKFFTSPTLHINQRAMELEANGREIFKFGFGQSPFSPPKHVLDSLKSNAHLTHYGNVQGDPLLREYVSKFHYEAHGIDCDPDNILIAPGSKILLFSIMATFKRADVLIPQPAWVSYAPQADLAGHHSIGVKTKFHNRWRVTLKSLVEAYTKKTEQTTILVLNYPGNPDGLSYTEEELEEIASWIKRNNVLVISDEIYGLVSHSATHHSLWKYCSENTLTTTGMSKWCGAGGWRLGIGMMPNSINPELKKTLIGVASETYSCCALPIQAAAMEAYKNYDSMKSFIHTENEILNQIGNACYEKINATKIKVHPPSGGFYMFPDFSEYREALNQNGITSSSDLCERILEDIGLTLLPASAFGFDDELLATRMAYVDFMPPENLNDFNLETHCHHLLKGVDLLIEWLEKQ